MSTTHVIGFIFFITLCSGGCSGEKALGTAEVLNHGNCKTLVSGLTEVSYERIAEIRDSRLIGMTTEAQPQQEPDLLLLAISKGDQPTPGYAFGLVEATLDRGTALIEFIWTAPAADAVLPQMTTHPCIVIGLETGSYKSVRAVDQTGEVLGELAYPTSTTNK